MKVIGYTRVSTDKQDLEKPKHLLLDDAQANQILIQAFIGAEASSSADTTERKLDGLPSRRHDGDTLLAADSSRLGSNMLQTLNIINELGEKGVSIIFVTPSLTTHTTILSGTTKCFSVLGKLNGEDLASDTI